MSDVKTCPDCAEVVKAAARICRYCRHEFTEIPVTLDEAAAVGSDWPPPYPDEQPIGVEGREPGSPSKSVPLDNGLAVSADITGSGEVREHADRQPGMTFELASLRERFPGGTNDAVAFAEARLEEARAHEQADIVSSEIKKTGVLLDLLKHRLHEGPSVPILYSLYKHASVLWEELCAIGELQGLLLKLESAASGTEVRDPDPPLGRRGWTYSRRDITDAEAASVRVWRDQLLRHLSEVDVRRSSTEGRFAYASASLPDVSSYPRLNAPGAEEIRPLFLAAIDKAVTYASKRVEIVEPALTQPELYRAGRKGEYVRHCGLAYLRVDAKLDVIDTMVHARQFFVHAAPILKR